VSLAFVGCGLISLLHLKAVQENNDNIFVSALIDPDPSKTSHLLSLCDAFIPPSPATPNPKPLIFSNLDEAILANTKTLNETGKSIFVAVDLMVPHHIHHKLTTSALRAGLHVLLEKPMAPTVVECDDIIKEAKKSDKVFMVAENSQYWPEVVRAKELIDEGRIGELITARAVYTEASHDERYRSKEQNDEWRNQAKLAGGGIALDGGSHWIRPLRIWFGEINEVMGLLGYPLKCMEGESMVKALFKFKSGKFASFDAIKADTFFAPDPWWRILGEKGEIVISDDGIKLYTKENPNGKLELDPPRGYLGSFTPELADFALVVQGRKTPAAGPEMSLGELRTALAIYHSAKSNLWAKVWDE